ncbi:enoyl-CoA hydratase/isomerase family protein [Mycobacterium sp. 94-17]|uniref:enoyl-CoA hydratase/isomerase family protein n=1 Tax=Mycobacterium sp. 94-17 TaxID=2986147 RepID=UPI002D1E9C45|nr:enoyl-CoA hydratase/isomerase family protein [Mycobacterium sp. 94-17]MEB4209300.1 enoyl-CoA hydratase/isomerase family protein [Mycobacterium sp. 94-17]
MNHDYATIVYERRADVGTLTLNRPTKLNAQNERMRDDLRDLSKHLLADATLRCLVVTGAGTSFSAGLDLAEAMSTILPQFGTGAPDEETIELGLRLAGVFEFIPNLRCPSVAAVRGHAYGAGLQLAIACDFRIFADNARVGLTETRYGLLPDMGATFRLPRLIGEARARQMVLLGEVIDATEALNVGLANRVVPENRLEPAVEVFAKRLAAQPPEAIDGARRAIDAGWLLQPTASLRVAVEAQARCLRSPAFRAARQAFIQQGGDRVTTPAGPMTDT